jgi:NDP-sugar pyrophosphorylase family protein
MYKVVIPSAGKGTRLKDLSKHINKALVSVNQKPSISYVIEKFPENIEIVVPVGYKSQTIKDFLITAYPKRKFTFIDVDLYEGKGSGLGHSLLMCKDELSCPFIFIPNDSIIKEDIPEPKKNWMGYSSIHDIKEYRSLSISKNKVQDIFPKGSSGDFFPYIGLASIFDHELFWNYMENGVKKGAIEVGESYGLKMLLNDKAIEAKEFTWHDTGNLKALEDAKEFLPKNKLDAHVLEKPDEAIWFCGDQVIKFHIDDKFISDRVKRSKNLGDFVPKIQKHADHMYSYNIVKGSVLSRNPTPKIFKSFLNFMSEFWSNPVSKDFKIDNFYKGCSTFYKDKTYERLELFLKRFEVIDRKMIVNGELIPCYKDVLGLLDWSDISKGIPVRFHGDLHFENILCTEEKNNPFCLLDWRQNFAGDTDVGDIYYDLAKLNHGLIVSHEIISNNHFEVSVFSDDISFEFHRKNMLIDCQIVLKDWVEKNNYDWKKVCNLTSLIFLNISPLHEHPYSLVLYYLGLSTLWNDLKSLKV